MAIVAAELNDTDIDTPAPDHREAILVRGWTLVAIACLAVIATWLVARLPPRMAEHLAAVPKAAATALVAATTPKIPIP